MANTKVRPCITRFRFEGRQARCTLPSGHQGPHGHRMAHPIPMQPCEHCAESQGTTIAAYPCPNGRGTAHAHLPTNILLDALGKERPVLVRCNLCSQPHRLAITITLLAPKPAGAEASHAVPA